MSFVIRSNGDQPLEFKKNADFKKETGNVNKQNDDVNIFSLKDSGHCHEPGCLVYHHYSGEIEDESQYDSRTFNKSVNQQKILDNLISADNPATVEEHEDGSRTETIKMKDGSTKIVEYDMYNNPTKVTISQQDGDYIETSLKYNNETGDIEQSIETGITVDLGNGPEKIPSDTKIPTRLIKPDGSIIDKPSIRDIKPLNPPEPKPDRLPHELPYIKPEIPFEIYPDDGFELVYLNELF